MLTDVGVTWASLPERDRFDLRPTKNAIAPIPISGYPNYQDLGVALRCLISSGHHVTSVVWEISSLQHWHHSLLVAQGRPGSPEPHALVLVSSQKHLFSVLLTLI